MSESLLTVLFLTLSGGLQDTYSYCMRGEVFANAQTGNIVLMSQNLLSGNWFGGLRYLVPLSAFVCGVFVAEKIRLKFKYMNRIHWRQMILLMEILLLICVGFIPHKFDVLANALVSFSCAMQVQAFRKVNGYAFASTMCIGNMRSGTDSLCKYFTTKEPDFLRKTKHYFGVIAIFAIGAGMGKFFVNLMGDYAIWVSSILLFAGFLLMFFEEESALKKNIKSALNVK